MNCKRLALLLPAVLATALLSGCSQAQTKPYESGQWDAAVCSSPFLSLSFTLPEGWTAAPDEDLAQMDEDAEAALEQQTSATRETRGDTFHYALLAKSEDGGTGVTILAQRSADTTAKDYVRALERGAEAEDSTFSVGETSTQTVAGKEYIVVPIVVDGNPAQQRQYLRSENGYLISLMAFAQDEADFAAIESAFSAP